MATDRLKLLPSDGAAAMADTLGGGHVGPVEATIPAYSNPTTFSANSDERAGSRGQTFNSYGNNDITPVTGEMHKEMAQSLLRQNRRG